MNVSEGKILVVDDDPQILDYISLLLGSFNYSVVTCSNAADAVAHVPETPVSVVLTDIKMPNISGIELLEKIREFNPEIPVILMTGYAELDTAIDAVEKGAFHFIKKPFKGETLLRAIKKAVKYTMLIEQEKNYKSMLENTVLQKTQELADTAMTANKMSIEIIQRLSAVAEFRDTYTGAHISRIGLYSKKIAEILNMHNDFIDAIAVASSLHDIGKIAIPDNILLKKGSLTAKEIEIMKEHTIIGSRILAHSSHLVIQMANSIALNHHESWEGGGYPRGLKGKEIPIEGRIVKLVDEYDALRSIRPYKTSMTHQEAFTILTEGNERTRPEDFDPEVLNAFRERAGEFNEIFNTHQDRDPFYTKISDEI
jgi:putative two-component system response regulator